MWPFRSARCSSNLSLRCLVFPVDGDPVARGDLADSAQHLVGTIQRQLQEMIGREIEVLWCQAASRKLWRARDLAPVLPSRSCNCDGVHLMIGAGFLLSDEPPLSALLALAARCGFGWARLPSC